jgi:predicted nucleic-acid-binding protein
VHESAYRPQKASILDVLGHVLHNQTFVLQNEHISYQSLVAYRANNADFADHLICAESDSADR